MERGKERERKEIPRLRLGMTTVEESSGEGFGKGLGLHWGMVTGYWFYWQ